MKHLGTKIYSQNDEDGIIQYLVNQYDMNPVFIEIGVEDYTECNTRLLWQSGWSGLIIDNVGPIESQERLKATIAHVDTSNINQLISGYENASLFSLDINGNDYWVWKSLVARPDVMVVEYNAAFGPIRKLVVPYNPNFRWTTGSTCFGASLAALEKLGRDKRYTLVYANGVNAFFTRDRCVAELYQPLTMHYPMEPDSPVLDLDTNSVIQMRDAK